MLQGVKKKEREGKFDRGAEGKAKNKLRKKMAEQPEKIRQISATKIREKKACLK